MISAKRSPMTEPPVVDASPLVILARAGHLDLLQAISERVIVPAAVANEVMAHSDEAARAIRSFPWLEPMPATPVSATIAAWDLGPGESSVLAWASTHPGSRAVIDDRAARTCAKVLNLPLIGTLGLALRAKARGEIPSARPLVEDLRHAGLYLSDALTAEALALVDE